VRGGDEALQLRRWGVKTDHGDAVSGQTVLTTEQVWTVSSVIDKVNGAGEEVAVRLVRGDADGRVQVVAELDGVTPFSVEHVETRMMPGSRSYYRLLVRSRTSMLTSNPIFVHKAG
jgi:hypothetical protein